MKYFYSHTPCSEQRGFAMITSLLIISGITLFAVALFALAQNELRSSSHLAQSYRARLASRAAFEDAKNLLIRHTVSDGYVVSSIEVDHEEEDFLENAYVSRYSFLAIPREDGVVQIPLFSGGVAHSTQAEIDFGSLEVDNLEALVDLPHQPKYEVESELEVAKGVIESLWMNFRESEPGEPSRPSESRPFVGYLEPTEQPDGGTFRYAYWIEDLQGFPNLDAVGMWSDHHEVGDDSYARDQHWLGYGHNDVRAEGSNGAGQRFELAKLDEDYSYGYHFPSEFRGQQWTGQIAPGLSPRELHLGVWVDPGIDGGDAILGDVVTYDMARGRDILFSNYSVPMLLSQESNRFVVGLKPYRQMPMIPFGMGYAGAGTPALNLNTLIAEEDVDTIAEHINEQLPLFESRSGGFGENYVKQIAANIVDYADEASEPTIEEGIRGVEAYPLVNEFFLKLEYTGVEDGDEGAAPDMWIVRFEATPIVELWNPTNQPIEGAEVQLGVLLNSSYGFEWEMEFYGLEGAANPNLLENGPADSVLLVNLEANEFKIYGENVETADVGFGKMEWEFEVPKNGTIEFVIPGMQTEDGESELASIMYDLSVDGVVVDRSGVAEGIGALVHPLNENGEGADDVVGDGVPPLDEGEYVIHATNPSRIHVGAEDGVATFFGDTLMAYWSGAPQAPVPYATEATPGGRNGGAALGEETAIALEVRHRDWPDRGYDGPLGLHPEAGDVLPSAVEEVIHEPELAPWRLSNLGRFYSLTELGHIHDPVMWKLGDGGAALWTSQEALKWSIPLNEEGSEADVGHGGGNSLRIGRSEHPLFNENGARASQLLDIFHVGSNGTNLGFGSGEGDDFEADFSAGAYADYDPVDHQAPPTALDEGDASSRPFSDIYPEDIHAQGDFRWVYGQLNLNTLPSHRDFRFLLEGLYTADNIAFLEAPVDSLVPGFEQAADDGAILQRQVGRMTEVIESLKAVRPLYTPSQVADAVAWSMDREETRPDYYADDVAEEPFARLFNTTTLSSRHFRIYAHGELLSRGGKVVSTHTRVYEVFLEPVRDLDDDPDIDGVRCQILSERDR